MKIYHLISESDLSKCLINGEITSSSIEAEGFCHCCFKEQIMPIANRFFKKSTIYVFEIDTEKLSSPMLVEDGFPHVYGKVNQSAVLKSFKLAPDMDNGHAFPDDLLI